MDVVAPGPEKDLLGLVGEDEAVGKVGGIHDLGAAEATIDDLMIRKVVGECLPEPDRRGADEEDTPLERRALAVGRLIGGDLFLPLRVVARSACRQFLAEEMRR